MGQLVKSFLLEKFRTCVWSDDRKLTFFRTLKIVQERLQSLKTLKIQQNRELHAYCKAAVPL